jgi:hypothetical protein
MSDVQGQVLTNIQQGPAVLVDSFNVMVANGVVRVTFVENGGVEAGAPRGSIAMSTSAARGLIETMAGVLEQAGQSQALQS